MLVFSEENAIFNLLKCTIYIGTVNSKNESTHYENTQNMHTYFECEVVHSCYQTNKLKFK